MSEEAVRAYAAGKRFAAATVERWLALDAASRAALLVVGEQLRLGENQFRDVLEAAQDVAARRGCPVAAVLAADDVRAVLEGGLGRNEAIKGLKNVLRRLRFPQLSAAEERVKALIGGLRLPSGASLEMPPNLEGEELCVRLRGRSAAELRARADAVAAALRRTEVEEMFAVLGGKW